MNTTSESQVCVSNEALGAIALMRAGTTDLATIANAVGLPLARVEQIEAANQPAIRQAVLAALPKDFQFRLRRTVKCPLCGSRSNLIPCLACKMARQRSTKARHAG